MAPRGTIQLMLVTGRGKPLSPRKLAGKVAKDLIDHAGLTQQSAGDIVSNLSYPTIKRIVQGAPNVGDVKLQAMAIVLKLPINLFLLIIDEDYVAIDQLKLPMYVREYLAATLPSAVNSTRPDDDEREDLVKG